MNVFSLREKVSIEGIGLHSGALSRATFFPSDSPGIHFRMGDHLVPASVEQVQDTTRGVSLGKNGNQVKTVEHLLAAVRWLGVQNLEIEIEGEEVPVLDGSAQAWVLALKPALVKTLQIFPEFDLDEPVIIEEKDAYVKAFPFTTLSVSYTIDYPGTPIGLQHWDGQITPEVFETELAPARTFGFMEEVKALWRRGLAQGGNWENCVVISRDAFLTPLRFKDEMVRHKVLDLMGDLALISAVPRARLEVRKGSHRLHTAMAESLLKFWKVR